MRFILTTLGVTALAVLAIADGQEDRTNHAHARQVFAQRCANCHFVPDPEIERDKAWLGLIKTTA